MTGILTTMSKYRYKLDTTQVRLNLLFIVQKRFLYFFWLDTRKRVEFNGHLTPMQVRRYIVRDIKELEKT